MIRILRGSQGLALFMAIFLVAVVLLFLSGSLVLSRIDTKITSNLKIAAQSFEVADAGLQHGLAVIPWLLDFDGQLNCGTPPCSLASNADFPPGSGYSYTVTAENDAADANPTDDTNSLIVLKARSDGPSGSTKTIEAYVGRSVAAFTPPSALYVNASSSSTAVGPLYFDDDDGIRIMGNDINVGNLLDPRDDSSGPNPPLYGIATTSDTVTTDLKNEFGVWGYLHDILGVGAEPSISTTPEQIDINQLANSFYNHPAAVKYLNGYQSNDATCPASSPCYFGTSTTPQITYIKDSVSSSTTIKGNVRGYGVLVVEGRTKIGGNFRFEGLVIHKRSDSTHYISFEDHAWVYGGVLFGSADGDVRFRVEDRVRLFYSSQALAMVESNWGSLLPKPARIVAWHDMF